MLKIGSSKKVVVRKRGAVVEGPDGKPETKIVESIVQRVTRDSYGHNSRYSRPLIVKIHGDDLITIRPAGMRTEAMVVTANIGQVYKDLLQRRLQNQTLAKAREKKERMKVQRERRNLDAKERRFKKGLRE